MCKSSRPKQSAPVLQEGEWRPSKASRILSISEAITIFDAFADRTDIAFNYSFDGCQARAHIMCKDLVTEKNITPAKAWFQDKGCHATIKMPDETFVQWSWHVAPVVRIFLPQNDSTPDHHTPISIKPYIFDPGLFDGPVLLEEWQAAIYPDPHRFAIAEYNQAPAGQKGSYSINDDVNYGETDSLRRMKSYIQKQKTDKRVVFACMLKSEFLKRADAQTRYYHLHGRSWISETLFKESSHLNANVENINQSNIQHRKPAYC